MSTPTYVVTKRHAVSLCQCGVIGEEPVDVALGTEITGPPYWYGRCGTCGGPNWHELLGFLEWYSEAPITEKE